MTTSHDVVIVGGGHNALVAAAYLGRAGKSVLVLERLGHLGGAAVSAEAFAGLPARLSRFSYLVSLLPDQIVRELGLRVELRSRAVSSYTPWTRDGVESGLLVERTPTTATARSFRERTRSDQEFARWQEFYGRVGEAAKALAPTLTEPLPSVDQVRTLVADASGGQLFDDLFERPLGYTVDDWFTDDLVRGVVATDGLIGTHTSLYSPELLANRCFLYHVIGNGSGEWRVPVGGMGAVSDELIRVAREAGAELVTGATVTSVEADDKGAQVVYTDSETSHTVDARFVLSGVAPSVLDRLRGRTPAYPQGAQLKINMLLTRLPVLRSGIDPALAFGGTFHLDETETELETGYRDSAAGHVPDPLPGELYCHSLTDPSILGPEQRRDGWHTMTLFGLHLPSGLFEGRNDDLRKQLTAGFLAGMNRYLDEPIENCLAVDAHGEPCVEAKTPLDIQDELGMPGGHIFHGDLGWPYADETTDPWGVATDVPTILMCGSGARRGGAVSGLGGHNAAQAILTAT
jgi:phytoene dehydrogenase-like protein